MKPRAAIYFCAMSALILAGCFKPSDPKLGVKEVDGVPILWEYGIPYFTRFPITDHKQLDLAGTWKFQPDPKDQGVAEKWFDPTFDDREWFDHPVPGSWNVQKPEWLNYVGAGWYRKRFTAPRDFSGRFNRLILDGVSFQGDVYLNGKFAGSHSGGFTRWNLEVSGLLNYGGENLLAIKVDNRRSWDTLPPIVHERGPLGWWPYGGIHRLAMIESGPMITVCKLAAFTDHRGALTLQGGVYNHFDRDLRPIVTVSLYDLAGNPVANLLYEEPLIYAQEVWAFKLDREIENIQPWSPDAPGNRYRLQVRVIYPDDREDQSVEIGFRKFEVKGSALYLNGRPFYIKGVNRHEDDPQTGRVQTDARIAEDLKLLRELHANLVRTSHYPNDPRFLDACDREGILVMEEISLHQVGWEYKGIRAAEHEPLFLNASRELMETIERDRNHPALAIYSLGDESFTFFPSIRVLHRRLYDLAKRFDNDRPVTMAIVTVPRKVTPWLEMTAGIGDLISVNEYFGWYYGEFSQLGPFLDSLHKKWPDKPIIISELGAEGVPGAKPGKLYPIGYGQSRDFTLEGQTRFYQEQLKIVKGKAFIKGVIPWVLADHRDDKRPKSAVPLMNTKGLLTYDRQKKPAFDLVSEFFQSWNPDSSSEK